MEITAITPQMKDKLRCNIEVDGRFFCGMKLETVMQNRLKAGMIVTEEELSRIQLESEKMTALDKALSYISMSMKTERQIREHMKKKGYLSDVVDYVVEKMRSYNYLDDVAYAIAYAESAAKKKGKKLIAMELRGKGICEEAINESLAGISNDEESAKKTLEKYMRGKTPDKKGLQKGYAYLLSKGYDYEVAKRALAAFGDTDEA